MTEQKTSTGNSMPMVDCPICDKEFQVDDWYDFCGDNEEVDCPNCNQTLYCTDTESVMYASFSTEPRSDDMTEPREPLPWMLEAAKEIETTNAELSLGAITDSMEHGVVIAGKRLRHGIASIIARHAQPDAEQSKGDGVESWYVNPPKKADEYYTLAVWAYRLALSNHRESTFAIAQMLREHYRPDDGYLPLLEDAVEMLSNAIKAANKFRAKPDAELVEAAKEVAARWRVLPQTAPVWQMRPQLNNLSAALDAHESSSRRHEDDGVDTETAGG